MSEQSMKQGLTFILLLVTTNLLGQFEIPRYDFDNVKGVDSIAIQITSEGDSWKKAFYYKNDRITKANYFFKKELSHYRLFHYDDKRQLIFESYHGKSSKFDSDKNDWIKFWDSTSYQLIVKRFSGLLLIEEKNCDVNGADTTVNQITTYIYDSKGRILSEVTLDVFVGLVGAFKSNSVDLKELEEKNDTIVYSRTHIYYLETKIEVLYKVNGKLTGREIVGLDNKKRIAYINIYDQKNTLLSEEIARYDEKGRLKSRTWKTHSSKSISGQEVDVLIDGKEIIEYDTLGRPSIMLTIYNEGNNTKTEYKYF